MSNDWKELDIANLPPDILVGDYEFAYQSREVHTWSKYPNATIGSAGRVNLIGNIEERGFIVGFRKRAPKAPTYGELKRHETECVSRMLEHCHNQEIRILGDAILLLLQKEEI